MSTGTKGNRDGIGMILGALVLLSGCAMREPAAAPSSLDAQAGARLAWSPPPQVHAHAAPNVVPYAPVVAPLPPPVRVPALATPVATPAGDREPAPPPVRTQVIIHQADMHGKLERRAGHRLTIEPLVATSSRLPAKGNKGGLYRGATDPDDDHPWLLVAEVEVAESMTPGSSLQLDVVEVKEDALVEGEEAEHLFAPNTRLMLRWQW